MTWIEVKRRVIKERGYKCEHCERAGSVEAHHVFFHRKKGMKELDVEENMMLVCRECHPFMNGYEKKCWYWDVQAHRYSEEHMREWHDSVPLKCKDMWW